MTRPFQSFSREDGHVLVRKTINALKIIGNAIVIVVMITAVLAFSSFVVWLVFRRFPWN